MNKETISAQRGQHRDIVEGIRIRRGNPQNVKPAYQFLFDNKNVLPVELFGSLLREMLQYCVTGVDKNMIVQLFEGVSKTDVMYDDELATIENWPDEITIYRGAFIGEANLGTSWSLRKSVAEEYSKGQVFKAIVFKKDVLLYFAHDADEEEVVIDVHDNFNILNSSHH